MLGGAEFFGLGVMSIRALCTLVKIKVVVFIVQSEVLKKKQRQTLPYNQCMIYFSFMNSEWIPLIHCLCEGCNIH